HNLVTLHIIKALIQTCHRDLNIFSKYIVKILNQLLDTRDLEITDLTCETFIIFCNYDDGSTLGVDSELTTDYETLLKKFAGFCNYTNEDSALSLKMRYIGHRAVQAAVTSSALSASDFKTQLGFIFPPLIVTLASSQTTPHKLETSGSIDIRHSAIDNNKVNDQVNELLAAHTISLLFGKVTGPLIRISLTPLFGYLNEKGKWWPPHLAVKIMNLVLDSLQPQYRYLLVSELLNQLETTDNILNDKHASIISVLDMILNADVPLVGISVLEVLNSLFTFLMKTTQTHSFNPYEGCNIQQDSAATTANNNEKSNTGSHTNLIQHKLVHSVGGLASQIYYENQLNDIIGYFVPKLRVNTSLEYVDDMLIYDYRLIVLSCLDQVVLATKKPVVLGNDSESRIPISPNISLDAWAPALGLLHDDNARTRMMFSKCLNRFLQHLPSKIRDDSLRQYAIESSLITWFIMVARFYHIDSLLDYMSSLQEKRNYSAADDLLLTETVNESELQTEDPESFSMHIESKSNNNIWIDRSTVVEMLSKDGNLRDETDTHGLELEAKLFTEWGSNAHLIVRNDQSVRSRLSHESVEPKPRLSSPWELSNIEVSVINDKKDRKNSIRVANLKEALVGQVVTADVDDVDTDSTQSNSISAHSRQPTALSMLKTKTEVNALLTELSLSHVEPSTISLLNPPYKST
ncbi:MAG: hypothetical protein EXX96DRAFT_491301, partial [Benjaminiella poitrasii]